MPFFGGYPHPVHQVGLHPEQFRVCGDAEAGLPIFYCAQYDPPGLVKLHIFSLIVRPILTEPGDLPIPRSQLTPLTPARPDPYFPINTILVVVFSCRLSSLINTRYTPVEARCPV